jgi:hypothetical protein
VHRDAAPAGQDQRRTKTGYHLESDLQKSGVTGALRTPSLTNEKKVAPANKWQGDMSGWVKTNPGRVEDNGSRATFSELPYSEY